MESRRGKKWYSTFLSYSFQSGSHFKGKRQNLKISTEVKEFHGKVVRHLYGENYPAILFSTLPRYLSGGICCQKRKCN